MKKFLTATFFISLGLWSCKDGGGGIGGGDEKPEVKTLKDSVTFNTMVKPVFTKYCNDIAGCHASGAGFIDLRKNSTAKDAATKFDMKKAINTPNPANPAQNIMPKGQAKLSQRNIDIIQYWIDKGFPE